MKARGVFCWGWLAIFLCTWPLAVLAKDDVQSHLAFDPNLRSLILQNIAKSQSAIDCELYELTDSGVVTELFRAVKRGVVIRIILCPSQEVNRKAAARLSAVGGQIKWYPLRNKNQLLHMKAGCFDRQCLILGSANWTHWGLTLHHEAVAVMREAGAIREFSEQFETDWEKSMDEHRLF